MGNKKFESILSENSDSTKKFTPFIGHQDYNNLPNDWKKSRYVKYGPFHDYMQEELNWVITKGTNPTNQVEKDWHDFRHNKVINGEAMEILKTGVNHGKRM